MAKPAPAANATTTTFQVGTYNPLNENATSDGFTLLADLNDTVSTWIIPGSLKMPAPDKTYVESGNIRSPGVAVVRWQYKARTLDLSISIRGASYAAMQTTVATIKAAVENPPYCIRFAWPGASQYSYCDVTKCTHNLPVDPILWLNRALPHYEIHFECEPGIRGDRVTLQNLVVNPGFEAPAGGGTAQTMPVVFSDGFANTNAYTVQAGGAPTTDKSYYTDTLLGDSPLVYYRLDEASGSVAHDSGSAQLNGTYNNSPTLGASSLLTGDAGDKSVTFNGTNQSMTATITGGPTGNAAVSIPLLVRTGASLPAGGATLASYGGVNGAHSALVLWFNATGNTINLDTGGGTPVTGPALTTNTTYRAVLVWDGTTLRLYINGSSVGTPVTPGNQAIMANPYLCLGAQKTSGGTVQNFAAVTVDEAAVVAGALSSSAVTTLDTAMTTSPATVAQSMQLASGGRVSFGSPAWTAMANWKQRFRYYAGATVSWYLHYTDANNNLALTLSPTQLALVNTVSGTAHTLATASVSVGNEVSYWVQITQFPASSNTAPQVQATLCLDAGGAVGAQLASVGPVATYNSSQSTTHGAPQIATAGAAVGIGGNYAGVHTVSLFGPGGWLGVTNFGTGPGSMAWAGSRWEMGMGDGAIAAGTLPSGPVTSYGALRMDLPVAGTTNVQALNYNGGAPAGTQAIPAASGQVLAASCWVVANYQVSTLGLYLYLNEYDGSGNLLRGTSNASIMGGPTGWTQLSGTWTLGASTAYVGVALVALDTTAGAEAGNVVVWDNVQVYNQTATGQTSMPYCELRFPQSPAQLMVSGLLGDMPAPAYLGFGAYVSSWAPGAGNLTFVFGRQAVFESTVSLSAQLCGPAMAYAATYGGTTAPVMDAASYNGYYTTEATAGGVAEYDGGPQTYTLALLGLYHLYGRARSTQATIANVTVTAGYYQAFNGAYANESAQYAPFAAANTWGVVDIGQMQVPSSSYGAVAGNPYDAGMMGYARMLWRDSTGGGSTQWQNWWSAVPIDGSLLAGTFNNPGSSGTTVTNDWVWGFVDPLALLWNAGSAAWRRRWACGAQPNPTDAGGGPGAATTQFIGINPSADTHLVLDPTNMGRNSSGVNMLCGHITDGNASVLALNAEMQYSPRYLWPR